MYKFNLALSSPIKIYLSISFRVLPSDKGLSLINRLTLNFHFILLNFRIYIKLKGWFAHHILEKQKIPFLFFIRLIIAIASRILHDALSNFFKCQFLTFLCFYVISGSTCLNFYIFKGFIKRHSFNISFCLHHEVVWQH